ncbi:zinc-dependent alcohol dehydrogenase [Angustibacter aerolatus]
MILALEMFRSIPRYAVARAALGRMPGLLVGPMAPLRLVTRDEPEIRRPGWVKVRPLLSGISGAEVRAVTGSTSLYFSALVSMPFVPGREVVGELVDDCEDLPRGTRVVIDPVLRCAARGIEPCGSCASGLTNRCDHVTVGKLSPGLQTGFCRDTGGGWGERFTAHRSQLHVVPDDLPDERAVLVEPAAVAVNVARRAEVPDGGSVLVSGAGTTGLLTVLALRELTNAGRITVIAKHPRQAELALRFGASDVARPGEALRAVRRTSRALQVGPRDLPAPAQREAGAGEMLFGGVDVAVDTAGTTESTDTVLRSTRAGGRVVLSGMPSGADLSPAWVRELEVVGAYASHGDAFDVATQLVGASPLEGVVGGRYPLHRWREAIDHAHQAGRLGTVKVCFDVRSRG